MQGSNKKCNSCKPLKPITSIILYIEMRKPYGINNVLIADDEDIVLEDLKNLIPWTENGFEIIATATNGTRAFELFEKYNPQIVISDIKMPGMDGIELCKRILAKDPNVKILLLTAYKDFNYVKDAISLGVSNYLLKHEINSQNLLSELDKIQKEISKEQIQRHLIRNRFFKRIIEDNVVEESILEFKDYNRKSENYVLLIVKMDVPFDVIDNCIFYKQNKLADILKINKENLPEFVNYFEIIEMQNGYVVIVLSIYFGHRCNYWTFCSYFMPGFIKKLAYCIWDNSRTSYYSNFNIVASNY